MHAAVRNYSGPGAKELFDRLEKNKKKVKKLIRGVPGFESYSLISTDDGGISVTVCKTRKGRIRVSRSQRIGYKKMPPT